MSRFTRTVLLAAMFLLFALPCNAISFEETLPDANTLAQMQAHALQAKPREQCFLYTQLVHSMTEIAGHQMLAGDTDSATATLKQVQHYADLLHQSLAGNTRRVMNAQLLMHHTTRRLDEYVHKASYEDRDSLQATLKQLNLVEDELLNQVFNH